MAIVNHPRVRSLGLALLLGLAPAAAVQAQVSVGIHIGVNVPSYPTLVAVPGYPVYYAPQASANYFFYDGLYWVYVDDNWYASSWYNGPWALTSRDHVPLFVLRIPVRYYRHPPPYFSGWRVDAPPRWDEHWGPDWAQRRPGWDRWDRSKTPAAAPLPRYQQKYPGDRYPSAVEQQREILQQNYRHTPREAVTREHFRVVAPEAPRRVEPVVPQRGPARDDRIAPAPQRPAPPAQVGPRPQKPGQPRPQVGPACEPGEPGCRPGKPARVAPSRQQPDEEKNNGPRR